MGEQIYRTREGDTLDFIVHRYYGHTTQRIVEQVYLANPELSEEGVILPAGLAVKLPEITLPETEGGIRLWE